MKQYHSKLKMQIRGAALNKIKVFVKNSALAPIAIWIYSRYRNKKSKSLEKKSQIKQIRDFKENLRTTLKKTESITSKFQNVQDSDHIVFYMQYQSKDILIQSLKTLRHLEESISTSVFIFGKALPEIEALLNVKFIENKYSINFIHELISKNNSRNNTYVTVFNSEIIPITPIYPNIIEAFTFYPNAFAVVGKILSEDGWVISAGNQFKNGTNLHLRDDSSTIAFAQESFGIFKDYFSIKLEDLLLQLEKGNYKDFFDLQINLSIKSIESNKNAIYWPFVKFIELPNVNSVFDGIYNKPDDFDDIENFIENYENILKLEILIHKSKNKCDNYLRNKRIIFIDTEIPYTSRDAGSVINFQYLKSLIELGYIVNYIAAFSEMVDEKDLILLHKMGIQINLSSSVDDLHKYIALHANNSKYIFVNRVVVASHVIDSVRYAFPNLKIIFSVQDLHFLRERRKSLLENNMKDFLISLDLMRRELELIQSADVTILPSEHELSIIERIAPGSRSIHIPFPYEIKSNFEPNYSSKRLIFVGGFLHAPNVDAILHFERHIWKKVQKMDSSITVDIVGSFPPEAIKRLNDIRHNFNVVGGVPDLDIWYAKASAFIAPLRYGAGVKGKVLEGLSYGLPGIVSAIASEGINSASKQSLIEAETDDEFAFQIVELLNNPSKLEKMGTLGKQFIQKHHSIESFNYNLNNILNDNNPKSTSKPNFNI